MVGALTFDRMLICVNVKLSRLQPDRPRVGSAPQPTLFAEMALPFLRTLSRLGAEGIVSKKVDDTYRPGPCHVWIKVRNPASIAVQRERSGLWNR
jgi:ATP-dependent DNA ligase